MGMFDGHLELLTDEALEERRAHNLGELNLDQVVEVLRVVREDLLLGNELRPEQISNVAKQNLADNYRQQISQLLDAMKQYGPTSQNPTQERAQLLSNAESIRDNAFSHLRPLLRPPIESASKMLADLDSTRVALAAKEAELDMRLAELQKQQQAVATQSGTEASTDLARHYMDQAEAHKKVATLMLRFAIASGIALAGLILVTFAWLAPGADSWTEFVRASTLRLLLLSVAAVALVFCLRNYRVNKHLEVLNKRRENALNTFGLFQGAVTSEDARNFVVQELVRAVFAHEDTGYVQAETERTVIESPSGVLSALAAARGREAGA